MKYISLIILAAILLTIASVSCTGSENKDLIAWTFIPQIDGESSYIVDTTHYGHNKNIYSILRADDKHYMAIINNEGYLSQRTDIFNKETDIEKIHAIPGAEQIIIASMTGHVVPEEIKVQSVKIDSNDVLSEKSIQTGGKIASTSIDDMVIDNSNHVFITGSTNSETFPSAGKFSQRFLGTDQIAPLENEDLYVMKLDNNLNLLWSRYLGGKGYDSASSMAINKAGDIFIAGFTKSRQFYMDDDRYDHLDSMEERHGFLIKLNKDGGIEWEHHVSKTYSPVTDIAITEEGNILITGETRNPLYGQTSSINGEMDVYLQEIDSAGKFLNTWTFGGSGQENEPSISLDKNGFTYLCGNSDSTDFAEIKVGSPRNQSVFLLILNSDMNTDASFLIGGNQHDFIENVHAVSKNEIYLRGATSSTNFPTPSSRNIHIENIIISYLMLFDAELSPAK